jgi:hypothetical protein
MGKSRRILFWLIPLMLILLGLAFYDYGYLAIQAERQSLGELKEAKRTTLEKYVNTIAQKSALENRINALKEVRKAEETKMVAGPTPSVAAASLQNMIKGIVTGRGGTITSERVEKPEDLNRFKVITVSIDAVLPETKALNDILSAIETSQVALAMRELDVRVRNMREPRELMVKFRVSAMNMGK